MNTDARKCNSDLSRADRRGVRDHSSPRTRRAVFFVREYGILEVLKRIRQYGLKASLDFVARNIRHSIAANVSRRFDRSFGVDTAGSIQLQYLTINSPNAEHGTEAVSTSPKSFDWMLKVVTRPLDAYTFIDLGCGKGRTLILARAYGFHKAIGVEFAQELVEIASKNIVKITKKYPGGASVVHRDASQFVFPDGPLVVYLYNPFGPEVFEKVIHSLVQQLSLTNNDCYVIYGSSRTETLSWFRPMIAGTGMFKELPIQPMPLFWDAVRTIHHSVFRRDHKAGAVEPRLSGRHSVGSVDFT